MGTFGGHALPGSFFIVFAIWWTIRIFQRYYMARFKGGQTYLSTVTFPCYCLCGPLKRLEIEGILVLLFTAVGFTLEIITGFKDGKWFWYGNGQHATMFAFFALVGVICILVHHEFTLPTNLDYVVLLMALIVEGLLFKTHLHGRKDLDVLIHTLLLYAIFASVPIVVAEMCFKRQVLPALGRAYVTLLQGTWFWQVGFILYSPLPNPSHWDQDNHDHMLVATMMFAWHMGVNFVVMVLIGVVIGWHYRRNSSLDTHEYRGMSMRLIDRDANGQTVVRLNENSDSDVEYERQPPHH